ncbi:hypothetical protein B9Z19DRAFT_1133048 [Tuber borchii]|uniref:Uncharacterized protein n=1 Tax=Tuber borchii TaxID=42251 RepID=A0A2T6ZGF8_TUBBO|nr:hypothetical protein B9Z19DRAFT_1133048 [Tuber borchii]
MSVIGTGMNNVSEAAGAASNAQSVSPPVYECDRENALKGIPTEQIYVFKTIENIQEIIGKTAGWVGDLLYPYLAFLDTPPEQLWNFDAVQTPGICKQYFESLRILVIKLPSKPQEMVTGHLCHRLRRAAILMGNVDEELSGTGSTTYRATNTICRNSCKEADGGIIPHQRRPGPQGWPTIIFESGVSESLERLQQGARWWLTQNNHEVRAVLLAHILCAEQVIDLQVWRMLPIQHPRSGTPPDAQLTPQCDNQLRIDCSAVPASTIGTVPFFVIRFEDLVLRPRSENERHFFLNMLDIQSIASVFRASL